MHRTGRDRRWPWVAAMCMALLALLSGCAQQPETVTATQSASTPPSSPTPSESPTPTPSPVPVGPPVGSAAPSVEGALRVGSSVRVDAGSWRGAVPLTFAYQYQVCTGADGSDCRRAPGSFADGARPQFLLTDATAGRWLKVLVTATNPAGSAQASTAVVGPIEAYPATDPPKVELVNGVPDAVTSSNHSIFEFQATGARVTLTCQLDKRRPTPCPEDFKASYADLPTGVHSFTVTAQNGAGSAIATHTWTVVPSPEPTPCPTCYKPAVGSTWQWQLQPDQVGGTIDTSVVADMYEIDGLNNDAAIVATLKSLPGTSVPRRGVTCYLSAGTLENWRPDAPRLDPMLLGNPYHGFENERWIDIRRISALAPLLEARMDLCKQKGFDAIEFDNMDAWYEANGTGLNITRADSVAFVHYLAREAHKRSLSMALKSVVEIVPEVRRHVDFSVVEECFANNECTRSSSNTDGTYGYDMMIEIGKPVFVAEYRDYNASSNVCATSNRLRFSTIYKRPTLDSYRVSCNG